MAKDRACKLQILSVKHPDLLLKVDMMFDAHASVVEVQRMIEQKYHEDASKGSVRTYKTRHWDVRQNMILERLMTMKCVAKLVGEDGLGAAVNALLWEAVQGMSVTQLMAFKKVLNDTAKVALLKKQFALYAKEHRQKMKQGAGENEDDLDPSESYARAQRVVAQVKEIFGIGMGSPRPALLTAGGQEPPEDGPTAPSEAAVA